jgi:hypothetical protein
MGFAVVERLPASQAVLKTGETKGLAVGREVVGKNLLRLLRLCG